MRILGIVLVIAGILMFVFRGIDFTKKEKVVDLGPVEINKKENKSVQWPVYAGGVVVILGIVLIVVDNKKK